MVVVRRLACSSMGLPRHSWWLPMQPRHLVPGVLVAVPSHAAVRVGNGGAAYCSLPGKESSAWPALAVMPSPHAQLHIWLHLISAVCTTPLVATAPRSVSPLLPMGVPGNLACAVSCVPRRVPPGLRSPGFVAPSRPLLPPWCPCNCAVQVWLGPVGLFGP